MSHFRLLIADDHAVIRTGLKYLLSRQFRDLEVVEATDCADLQARLEASGFTHLVLDLQLGDCNSLDLIPVLRSTYPDLAILVYTMSPETIYGRRLLQSGVLSFVSKQANEETVIRALDLFLQGRPYLSDELRQAIKLESGKSERASNPFDELSEREMAVMRHLLQGLRVKEISNRMDLKMSTVATYKVRIFEKLGIDNMADLHRLADAFKLV